MQRQTPEPNFYAMGQDGFDVTAAAAAGSKKGAAPSSSSQAAPASSSASSAPKTKASKVVEMTTSTAASAAGHPPASSAASGGSREAGVDMWSHNGLRGAAAVWIVIFHCYGLPNRSEVLLNLEGSTIMPMFFMLSGFALAATYGKRLWAAPPSLLPSICRRRPSRPDTSSAAAAAAAAAAVAGAAGAEAAEEGRAATNATTTTAITTDNESQPPPPFPLRAFYQNRAARVLPVYYFTLLLCLPLWIVNVGDFPFARATFIPSLVTSVVPSTTLLSPLSGTYLATLNPPGWFVCTLVCFFLFFPRWLASAQRLSDGQLLSRIVWHYWLQWALLQGTFSLLPLIVPGMHAFTTATMNPLTRFPLFLMGIYAGLLALRHPHVAEGGEEEGQRAEGKETAASVPVAAAAGGGPTVGTAALVVVEEGDGESPHMPWPVCFLGCFPIPRALAASRCGRALLLPLSTRPPTTKQEWGRMATWQSAGVLVFTLAVAAADSTVSNATDGRVVLRSHVWLQALVPMVQLNVLVALTRDSRRSLAARALGTRLARWLGKISMDVYLVHWPIIAYTALALHGPGVFETLLGCYGVAEEDAGADPLRYEECSQAMAEAKRFPPWGVVVILPLALVAGEALFRYVEEPARKLLRSRERPAAAGDGVLGKARK